MEEDGVDLQYAYDLPGQYGYDTDSDVDENEINGSAFDITAAQARQGEDIQGIPWGDLTISRHKCRQTRLEQYRNFENLPYSGEVQEKVCKVTEKGHSYYEFVRNSPAVRPTIMHFQLRNLVWATSKHDVYYTSHYSIMHFLSLTSKKSEVLNVSGHVAPKEHHGNLVEGFSETQVSTLAVKDKLLVAGGFLGELICKDLNKPGVSYCTRATREDSAITNAVEIYTSSSGAEHFIASNNDCGVRDYDMEKFKQSCHLSFPWPVNHSSLSPDGTTVVVVGDDPVGFLADFRTGETIASLKGHEDYSFASAWHPNGRTFVTGNQDKSCRVWDVRYLAMSVAVLKGNLGSIRSLRYTSDGKFMAMAEPADFVHVFDVGSGYHKEQEIDFFGEISGISFSPDDEALFVGIWDRTYGSLMEFERRRNSSYLDAIL